MKSSRFLLPVALMSLSTVAFAQSDASQPGTHSEAHASSVAVVSSETQKSFDQLKSLAGEWTGPVTVAEMPELHTTMALSLRVTSRGHVIVHEFQEAGTPLDPTKYDHPVTMFYVDGDQLTLVHYCDAGNRPRMIGTMSPDGKTVEFELVDIAGAPSTTCTMPCSPSSTRTITPRIGRT